MIGLNSMSFAIRSFDGEMLPTERLTKGHPRSRDAGNLAYRHNYLQSSTFLVSETPFELGTETKLGVRKPVRLNGGKAERY